MREGYAFTPVCSSIGEYPSAVTSPVTGPARGVTLVPSLVLVGGGGAAVLSLVLPVGVPQDRGTRWPQERVLAMRRTVFLLLSRRRTILLLNVVTLCKTCSKNQLFISSHVIIKCQLKTRFWSYHSSVAHLVTSGKHGGKFSERCCLELLK